jgi:fatty acid desaturase
MHSDAESDAAELPGGDLSTTFLRKSELVDEAGTSYREFRRRLTPRYGVVWSQLALGYAVLVLVGAGIVLTENVLFDWIRVLLGAALFGFFQAYIQLFMHEAAHFNFVPGRRRNDVFANLCIGAIHGLEIRAYRLVHFEHHRRLGTTEDSERSYFDPLNMRFIAESLLGIKGLKVLARREGVLQESRAAVDARAVWQQRVFAAMLHLSIIGGAVAAGESALAIAWFIGTFSVMPLFVALRQLLEHRSEEAESQSDYMAVDHGAVNRLFGDGPVASTLGGAGFNRHLLHHWEPQISYTRMRELEDYLLRTNAAEGIRQRQTTYWRTFWALISW